MKSTWSPFPNFKHNLILWTIAGSAFLLPSLFSGSVVTYDGQFYIESAKAISSFQIRQNYFVPRTPGYPLFLSFCHLIFGHSLHWVIAMQSFLIVSSCLLLTSHLISRFLMPKNIRERNILLGVLILFSQLDVLGYASAVLEQAQFIFTINMMIFLTLKTFDSLKFKNFLLLSLVLIIGVLTSPVLIIPGIICILQISCKIWRVEQKPKSKLLKSIFFALIALFPALISYGTWLHFDSSLIGNAKAYNVVTPIGAKQLEEVPGFFVKKPMGAIDSWTAAYVAESGLVPSLGYMGVLNIPNPPLFENRIQAEMNFFPARRCGLYDNVNNSPWVIYNSNYFTQVCSIATSPTILFLLLEFFTYVSKFSWLCWLPILILYLVRTIRNRNPVSQAQLVMTVPIFGLAIGYILLGAQPDRYIVPCLTPYLLSLFLFASPAEKKTFPSFVRGKLMN